MSSPLLSSLISTIVLLDSEAQKLLSLPMLVTPCAQEMLLDSFPPLAWHSSSHARTLIFFNKSLGCWFPGWFPPSLCDLLTQWSFWIWNQLLSSSSQNPFLILSCFPERLQIQCGGALSPGWVQILSPGSSQVNPWLSLITQELGVFMIPHPGRAVSGQLNCAHNCWLKNTYNLTAKKFILFGGLSEDLSPRGNLLDSSEGLLERGNGGCAQSLKLCLTLCDPHGL